MCDAIRHRGPDGDGYIERGAAALGHRRLSIIDLAGGSQPMSNEDGRVWVSFNGEIYNYPELRPQLEARGHRFSTNSDTEVILHLYEERGARCVDDLRGMFAFALWDERTQTLLLARDRVGKKPLFYGRFGAVLVFASELQALVTHPAVETRVDTAALDEYLTYGYIPAPRTIFSDVFKLPPAHVLSVRPGAGPDLPAPQRYWELPYTPKLALSEGDAREGLLSVLDEAVRLRQIADVPIGALLSGGIDSSVIVALMSRSSPGPVKTFSIGFEEQRYNELPFARAVAERYGTDHHEMVVRPDALAVLPKLVRHYGEPFADSSAIPSFYVAELTRQHVTVALNGDGGDECLAGYDRHVATVMAQAYGRVPAALRKGVIEPAIKLVPDTLPPGHRARQVKRLIGSAAQPLGQRYLGWMTYFSPAEKAGLYEPECAAQLGGHDAASWMLEQISAAATAPGDDLDRVLGADMRGYLPYDLLVKMDIASMAASLEARSPFLDHKVMEFCARLPSRYKVRGTSAKFLLKSIAKDLIPAENITRRKMGFGVPVGDWMRGALRPLLEDVLLSSRSNQRGYFRPDAVRRLVERHTGGGEDCSFQLWSLLCLELWHREFVDAPG